MAKDISLNDLYALIKSGNSSLSQQIDCVSKDLGELKKQVELELKEVKEEVEYLKQENASLRDRLKKTERLVKRNNLIVHGIVEEDHENIDSVLNELLKTIREKLHINLVKQNVSSFFRLGKPSTRSRPLLLEVISNFHKREILQKRALFKGTNIYIAEDLIPEDHAERQTLVEALKVARNNNQTAKLKGKKIIIEGKGYTAEEVRNLEGLNSRSNLRLSTSEPSTPSSCRKENLETVSIIPEETISEPSIKIIANPGPQKADSEKKRKLDLTPVKTNPPKRTLPYSTRASAK